MLATKHTLINLQNNLLICKITNHSVKSDHLLMCDLYLLVWLSIVRV